MTGMRFEKISTPNFSSQLENKVLFSEHKEDISISYRSTYTLKYVLEGSKTYSLENRDIEVSKNQYLLLNHGNHIHTEAKQGASGLSFFLSPQLIEEIHDSHYSHTNSPIEFFEFSGIDRNDAIGFWLHQTTQFLQQTPFVTAHQIDDLLINLSEVLVKKQLNTDQKFAELEIIKFNTKKELYRFVSLSKEYLRDNIDCAITLDTISKNVGVSKYYLHRLFTEITGSTPLEYLTHVRLEKAKEQLENSSDSILGIAIACGFDSTSYFSKVFKRHLGLSPSQYRKGF